MNVYVSSLMIILDMVMCIWWKSESFEKLKGLKNEVKIQIRKSVKIFRSNWGGKYFNQDFQDYLQESEILSYWKPPRIPQHNEVSKRRITPYWIWCSPW